MPTARRWNRRWSVATIVVFLVVTLACRCSAARPGREGVQLSTSGSVIQPDGTTLEEYELRESDPMMAHFVSLGSAAQQLLNKSGFAYGSIVRITHSDKDKEYGEGSERAAWFPMAIFLDVFEEGVGDRGEDVTSRYEVALDYRPQIVVAPGIVILEARKLDKDGGVVATLDVLPAEKMGFLEKNRAGITMMFGVIIASGIVKILRRGMERLVKKAKQDREEGEAAATTVSETKPSEVARGKGSSSSSSSNSNPKRKKGGSAKED